MALTSPESSSDPAPKLDLARELLRQARALWADYERIYAVPGQSDLERLAQTQVVNDKISALYRRLCTLVGAAQAAGLPAPEQAELTAVRDEIATFGPILLRRLGLV